MPPPASGLTSRLALLRRGLHDRAILGRQRLQQAAAGLSAPLLRSRLARAQERLQAARLAPSLVAQRIAVRQERLAALWRMAAQLDPREVLKRGYAIVRDAAGKPVMSAAAARSSSGLEIEFADGRVALGSAARPRPGAAAPGTPPEQGKLL